MICFDSMCWIKNYGFRLFEGTTASKFSLLFSFLRGSQDASSPSSMLPFHKTKFFEFQLLFHFWTSMSFYFLQLYFNFFNNIESRAYITRGESIFFFDIFIEIFVKLSSRRTLFSFVGYVLQVFEKKKKKKLAILEGWFWNMANRLKILKNGCFRCA